VWVVGGLAEAYKRWWERGIVEEPQQLMTSSQRVDLGKNFPPSSFDLNGSRRKNCLFRANSVYSVYFLESAVFTPRV
jgi:hypothetical protein